MGIWEILLIAFIALVVAGPERLPDIMRTIGHWVGRGKGAMHKLQSELEREGRSLDIDEQDEHKPSAGTGDEKGRG